MEKSQRKENHLHPTRRSGLFHSFCLSRSVCPESFYLFSRDVCFACLYVTLIVEICIEWKRVRERRIPYIQHIAQASFIVCISWSVCLSKDCLPLLKGCLYVCFSCLYVILIRSLSLSQSLSISVHLSHPLVSFSASPSVPSIPSIAFRMSVCLYFYSQARDSITHYVCRSVGRSVGYDFTFFDISWDSYDFWAIVQPCYWPCSFSMSLCHLACRTVEGCIKWKQVR